MVSNRPAVSVITPTKNRLSLLCEAIDSVKAQTTQDWEHLIIDDGSDDGTAEEVVRRAGEDERIRFIRREGEKNGANVCRNIGIRESKANYVVFLDSDDLLEPQCLENRLEFMERNLDLDFSTFGTGVFLEKPGDSAHQFNNETMGDDLLRFLSFEPPWIITGPIWRKESLVRVGLFDETLKSWQDIELHVRALCQGCHYLRIADIDHHVRWQFEPTKVSVEQRRSPAHLRSTGSLLKKFEGLVRQGPGMNWNRQRAICGLYFLVAELHLEAEGIGAAIRAWRKAAARNLCSGWLFLQGAFFLLAESSGRPLKLVALRAVHKWKGLVRFRTIPDLID